MAVRLIALDIDGTLLNSHGQIPAENIQAIADARARGIEIALVTGRRYDFAKSIADRIEQDFVMIVSNGALIRSKSGETHIRRLLPREIAREVLADTAEYREGASVIFDRPRENQVVYESLVFTNPARQKYYQANREFISEISPLENCLTEDPIQVVFTGPVETMRRAVERLRRNGLMGGSIEASVEDSTNHLPSRLPGPNNHRQRGEPLPHLNAEKAIDSFFPGRPAGFEIAVTEYESRDFTIVDVLRKDCTKGRALAEWARKRSIAREEIMAIGDNWNDREMLAFVGLPVVMGNAAAALKLQANSALNSTPWQVTLSNDECGVAAAIRQFALGE
jgi:hydroxymethylpyrimidine pyrophosphatase-like HAD family hydrolase